MIPDNNTSQPIAEVGKIVSIKTISSAAIEIMVRSPQIATHTYAGQFVHVRMGDNFRPFLRRPLSVGLIDGDLISLVFTIRGSGTKLLAEKKPNDDLDLIGPLGNGFPKEISSKDKVILIGGGIGIVPLLLLADQLPKTIDQLFILGVRSSEVITVTPEQIKKFSIQIATDDGSMGFNGNSVQLLDSEYANLIPQNSSSTSLSIAVCACGPTPMLAALKGWCVMKSIPLWVSLEVPMGCGVGACMSCAVPEPNANKYHLVCREGPVFDASLVDLRPVYLLWA